jgi:hypothetical protein
MQNIKKKKSCPFNRPWSTMGLSGLPADRHLPPGRFLVPISVRGWDDRRAIMQVRKILPAKIWCSNVINHTVCWIWGSHSCDYEELYLLGYNSTQSDGSQPTFRCSPKRRLTFSGLHGVVSQKIELFKCHLMIFIFSYIKKKFSAIEIIEK